MPAVSKPTLKILAALVWYAGGVILALKALALFREAYGMRPEWSWIVVASAAGLSVGVLKARFLFDSSCRKNLARIDALETPRLWLCFRPWFYLALAAMIATGATLSRAAQDNFGHLVGVGGLDVALSTALLVSGRFHWRQRAGGTGR